MNTVKKLLRKMKTSKRNVTVVTGDEMCKDAVADPPRNIERKVPERSQLYQNFRIDNCKEYLNEPEANTHHSNFNSISSEQEESLKYSCSESPDSEAIPITNINDRPRSVSSPEPELQHLSVDESHFIHSRRFHTEELRANDENMSHFGSESSTGSESDARETSEIEESVENLTNLNGNDEITLNSEKDEIVNQKKNLKKRNNKTVVINISNSKHFQIGSQKNVFVNSAKNNSLPIQSLGKQIKNLDLKQNTGPEMLLHQENRLFELARAITDQEIAKVASHIDKDWIMKNFKEFGENLGLEESEVDNIERGSGENAKLIAFDMLKTLKEKEPNTSVAFIAKVLTKSNQFCAIQQLAS